MSIKSDSLQEAVESVKAKKSEERMVPTFCSLCGPMAGCGLNCYVKDGRLIRVEGMKEAPTNKGKAQLAQDCESGAGGHRRRPYHWPCLCQRVHT